MVYSIVNNASMESIVAAKANHLGWGFRGHNEITQDSDTRS